MNISTVKNWTSSFFNKDKAFAPSNTLANRILPLVTAALAGVGIIYLMYRYRNEHLKNQKSVQEGTQNLHLEREIIAAGQGLNVIDETHQAQLTPDTASDFDILYRKEFCKIIYTEERKHNHQGVDEKVFARLCFSPGQAPYLYDLSNDRDRSDTINMLVDVEGAHELLQRIRVHGPIPSDLLHKTVKALCGGIYSERPAFFEALTTLYNYRPGAQRMKDLLKAPCKRIFYQTLLRDRITDAERDEILIYATKFYFIKPAWLIEILESGTTSKEAQRVALVQTARKGNLDLFQTMMKRYSFDQSTLAEAMNAAEEEEAPVTLDPKPDDVLLLDIVEMGVVEETATAFVLEYLKAAVAAEKVTDWHTDNTFLFNQAVQEIPGPQKKEVLKLLYEEYYPKGGMK